MEKYSPRLIFRSDRKSPAFFYKKTKNSPSSVEVIQKFLEDLEQIAVGK